MAHHFDDITLLPFKKELSSYSWRALQNDFLAALAVSLLTLPQAMAYALVAGLPLSCGLFAAIFSPLIASLFMSSRHLVVGPCNSIAILIQYGTANILYIYYRDLVGWEKEIMAVQILTQLSLLVAIFQLIGAFFKLGRLTQFVSHSVVIGYISGAALAILANQLFVLFGVPPLEGVHSIFKQGIYFFTHLNQIHLMTTLVGVCCLVMLIAIRRMDKRFPAAAITFAVAGIFVFLISLLLPNQEQNVLLLGNTVQMTGFVPRLSLPYFNPRILNDLLFLSFAVAMLSILETTSVAKTIAARTGQRLSTNQEIFGLSLGNFLSSFIGAMPVSGSTSRTVLNYSSGAQTRVAAILGAIFVGLFVFIFSFVVTKIPLTALAALLVMTAIQIFDKKQLLLCIKATSVDALVFWVTLFSCIFFSLDVALYIGVALSITLYLKKAALPQLVQFTIDENDKLKFIGHEDKEIHANIRLIKVKGELFFGAADLFQRTLKSIAEDDTQTRVIILHLKNARDLDATACLAIKRLHEYLASSGRHLLITGVPFPTWVVLSSSGLVDLIGKENIFFIEQRQQQNYMQKALQRARELAKEQTYLTGSSLRRLPESSVVTG